MSFFTIKYNSELIEIENVDPLGILTKLNLNDASFNCLWRKQSKRLKSVFILYYTTALQWALLKVTHLPKKV
jgi:hypothetical protein